MSLKTEKWIIQRIDGEICRLLFKNFNEKLILG